MNAIEIIERATELVERGWIQGDMGEPNVERQCMCYCLVGALGKAATASEFALSELAGALLRREVRRGRDRVVSEFMDGAELLRAADAVAAVAARSVTHEGEMGEPTDVEDNTIGALVAWNDWGDRTQAEVVKVLRDAAAELREAA